MGRFSTSWPQRSVGEQPCRATWWIAEGATKMEITGGRCTLTSPSELDEFLALLLQLTPTSPSRAGPCWRTGTTRWTSRSWRARNRRSQMPSWEAILKTKAVRFTTVPARSALALTKYPDRIVSSQMVCRKKPTHDLHQWKAKSRW